jgi:hypothetical protein
VFSFAADESVAIVHVNFLSLTPRAVGYSVGQVGDIQVGGIEESRVERMTAIRTRIKNRIADPKYQ